MKPLLATLLVLLLAGCLKAPPPALPLYPELGGELLASYAASSAARRTLKGMVRMTVRRDGDKNSFSQALLLEKPDRLRSDVFSPFGTTLLQASSDGQELALYLPGERRFLRGPATPLNLLALTRVPLPAEELVDLLLYSVPLLDAEPGPLQVSEVPDYTLELTRAGFRQQLRFDSRRRLVAARWYRDSTLLLQVDYAEIDDDDGFPREVAIEVPGADTALRVVFKEPRLNAPIREELFRLSPPADVAVEAFPGAPSSGTPPDKEIP